MSSLLILLVKHSLILYMETPTIADDSHIQYELPEKESCKQKNPFHNRLKTSFPDFNSPSVFRVQSTPLTTAKPFKWSVEEMAVLQPVDIEEFPNQEVVDNSYFLTPRRAEASTKFFSGIHSIPSLMSPCSSSRSVCPTSRTVSNQTPSTETPNPYSFSRPPEMLNSPTPSRDPLPEEDPPSPQVSCLLTDTSRSLPNKSRGSTIHSPLPPSTEPGVDVGVQTMLTLPAEFDLERALGRYAFYQGEEMANSSLRRILFHPSQSPPQTDRKKRPPSPAALPRNSVSTPRKSGRADPQETPKTSKHLHRSHSKSFLKSRLIKRHPVSSLNNTSSTPSSFLLSLMSGKLECSNLPTPIAAVPFLSPIPSHTDPGMSRLELEKLPGDMTPPRNSDVYEECSSPLLQEQDPVPVSPLTCCKPATQGTTTSPAVYKATSTPFLHTEPKTPQSRHLSISILPPGAQQFSPRDTPDTEYTAYCQEENVMQEDAGPSASPVTFSDVSQVPDRLQATHSLECDSGIGSSYGEQSSLMQSQSRSRAKPGSTEHQLSFSFCPDKPLSKPLSTGCSLPSENVSKLRSKRGYLKGDGSLLSIVHRAQPTATNESKRYQPDGALHESFSDSCPSSSSLKDLESDLSDPLIATPGLVQQQAKQIETIAKLKNFSKWTVHKKNIEERTNQS